MMFLVWRFRDGNILWKASWMHLNAKYVVCGRLVVSYVGLYFGWICVCLTVDAWMICICYFDVLIHIWCMSILTNWISTWLVWWLMILIMVCSCLHGISVQSLWQHWKLLSDNIFHDIILFFVIGLANMIDACDVLCIAFGQNWHRI